MIPDEYENYTDAEISEDVFDELFDENSEVYEQSEVQFPDYEESDSDDLYFDESPEDPVDELIEQIQEEVEGLSPEEAYEYVAEAWPALIPLIAAIAPSVIQAATSLAPVAVKAVGGLMGGGSKRRTPRRNPRRVPRQSTQRPRPGVYQPVQRACNCQQSGGGVLSGIGKGALGTLANLLGNKNVQGIISNLANKGISQALKLGNSQALAREGALLEAIEYLAREAQSETLDDQFEDATDYLTDPHGNIEVDIDSPDSRAERFIELFES